MQIKKPNSSVIKKNISDFKIFRSLGKGSFGQVYMVKDEEKRISISNLRKVLCNENNTKNKNTN